MVSYLCEITTHRGQCFHPTPPPCFIKQGKTRTKKFATKKKQFNSCGMVLYKSKIFQVLSNLEVLFPYKSRISLLDLP